MDLPDLSPEQAAVVAAIENTRDHIFVTGRAGTGKSTLLEHLSWHSSHTLAICAPTGVAALNVGGQTIHSLFRLPIGVIADHEIDQGPEVRKLLSAIDTLVIDEVSMVNADLMDAIDRSLRQARGRPHEAFGGTQIILFGDPYQLAPVPGENDERAYFADHYRSMWFFDAKVWDEADLRIFELTTIHRQHELEFKQLLTAVRHGSVTAEMAHRLNSVGARPAPTEGAITLATTNAAVNRINAQGLGKLPGLAPMLVDLAARLEARGLRVALGHRGKGVAGQAGRHDRRGGDQEGIRHNRGSPRGDRRGERQARRDPGLGTRGKRGIQGGDRKGNGDHGTRGGKEERCGGPQAKRHHRAFQGDEERGIAEGKRENPGLPQVHPRRIICLTTACRRASSR